MSKIMKPHLVEINTLKGILSQLGDWINLYKKLLETETIYSNLYNSVDEKEMKRYYKKRLVKTEKRINVLAKRLNFSDMERLFNKITNRIQILYQFDRELQQDDNITRRDY